MIKRICIFGASIAFGSGDKKFGGWQNHLKVWFGNRGQFQHVFNLAVSGRTTNDIIERFERELLSRKSSDIDDEVLAIVGVPINDSRFVLEKNQIKQEISKEVFQSNLQKIKNLAGEYADEVVFLEMTKVVDEKTNPWDKVDNGHSWKNSIIKKYNKILEEFCKKEKMNFIPMFDLLDDQDLPDGLHPNSVGHQKMFERIKEFLEKEVLTR